jgi:hypothetical protein
VPHRSNRDLLNGSRFAVLTLHVPRPLIANYLDIVAFVDLLVDQVGQLSALVVEGDACEATSNGEVPYWEYWFSPTAVLMPYGVLRNMPEWAFAPVVQSLISQGCLLLPPAEERLEEANLDETSLPDSCQVAGLGFEKYAEATVEDYLDLMEEVSTRVASTDPVSHQAIAKQLGVSPDVVAHIIHYHELL